MRSSDGDLYPGPGDTHLDIVLACARVSADRGCTKVAKLADELKRSIDLYRRILALDMDQQQRSEKLRRLAEVYLKLSCCQDREDNLCQALASFRQAWDLASPRDCHHRRADISQGIGTVLAALWDITGERERARQAILAYQQAREIFFDEQHWPSFLQVQIKRGALIRHLARKEGDPAMASEAALSIWQTMKMVPDLGRQERALLHVHLGNACLNLAEMDASMVDRSILEGFETAGFIRISDCEDEFPNRTKSCLLLFSVSCYQQAIELSQGTGPASIAALTNMGAAYLALGTDHPGWEQASSFGWQAVQASRESLLLSGPGPEQAAALINLGRAYRLLAGRQSPDPVMAAEAVEAHRQAADMPGRHRLASLANLGISYRTLAEAEDALEKEHLHMAVLSWETALREEADPEERVDMLADLCSVHLHLSSLEERDDHLAQAVSFGRSAKSLEGSVRSQHRRAGVLADLCMALSMQAASDHQSRPLLEEAYRAGREALDIIPPTRSSERAVVCRIMLPLCQALADLTSGTQRTSFWQEAVDAGREALAQDADLGVDAALLQKSMADALIGLYLSQQGPSDLLLEAVSCCQMALMNCSSSDHPWEMGAVLKALGFAQASLGAVGHPGRYRLALKAYKRALRIYLQQEPHDRARSRSMADSCLSAIRCCRAGMRGEKDRS
ncbi:MAG: hypothetical protein A4E45_00298 [Methanosaeta sp. PtaB.Bin039]|nr:MAG: hypothetical protein A4E45_00298 [Methanosaeta sp. PtaB.Bin039]